MSFKKHLQEIIIQLVSNHEKDKKLRLLYLVFLITKINHVLPKLNLNMILIEILLATSNKVQLLLLKVGNNSFFKKFDTGPLNYIQEIKKIDEHNRN